MRIAKQIGLGALIGVAIVAVEPWFFPVIEWSLGWYFGWVASVTG